MFDLLNSCWISLSTRLRRDDGQAMTEYALVLAVIAIAAVASLTLLTGEIDKAIKVITDKLPG